MWSVVAYEPAQHEADAYALWLRALGEKWAIEQPYFKRMFAAPAWVATIDARLAGFVGTNADGALTAILVDEPHRRKGLASALFDTAIAHLAQAGHANIKIGGTPFLFKGIPLELTSGLEFFRSRGCVLGERHVDQYRFLAEYEHPGALIEQLREKNLHLVVATKADAEKIIEFEQTHFPHWREFFETPIRWRRYHDIVCAKAGDDVVGAALVSGPGPMFPGAQWSFLSQRRLGTYATLGIAPSHRGLNLGYALSAFATETVRQRGAESCFINQSEAVSLYEKFGFRNWAEFQSAEYRR